MTRTPYQTARADQYRAAARDANRTVILAGTATGTRTRVLAGGWLDFAAREFTTALNREQPARACVHVTDSPAVVYAAAWAPGTLACPTCAPAALAVRPDQDTTCDRCHRTANTIHNGMAALGPILFLFGLCDPCATATGLDTTQAVT